MSVFAHTSVLLNETLDALGPVAGAIYCDATLGGGGHTRGILERSAPDGRVVGIDRDPSALAATRERLEAEHIEVDRLTFVHGTFGRAQALLAEQGIEQVDGLVADVGVSSPQLDQPERGFSFRQSGPLDMRMDPTSGETALELIERLDAESLANVLFELGEERRSRAIARSIIGMRDAGELATTGDLRHAVLRAVGGGRGGRGKPRIDPATRTFQALRIAVNDELGELRSLLEACAHVLADGAVVAVISFHSLEDRIVKWAFREDASLEPLSKKPVTASELERDVNPRARTAKLRAARRRPRGEAS